MNQASSRLSGLDIGKLTGLDKVGSTFAGIDIGKLAGLDKNAENFRGIARSHNYTPTAFEMPDWSNTPDARAARASEQTAAHLEVLVNAALQVEQHAADAEKREHKMLRWTQASVILAGPDSTGGRGRGSVAHDDRPHHSRPSSRPVRAVRRRRRADRRSDRR